MASIQLDVTSLASIQGAARELIERFLTSTSSSITPASCPSTTLPAPWTTIPAQELITTNLLGPIR
jgi:uncharacterized oxidoreductase